MPDSHRERAVWLYVELEQALRRAGGDELVEDVRAEARWYADLYHPLDPDTGTDNGLGSGAGETPGDGDAAVDLEREPLDRLHARLEVLSERLERARGDVADSG